MKTRGEMFYDALASEDSMSCIDFGTLPETTKAEFERHAAEYDKAICVDLPADVEAFVTVIEEYVAKGDGGADEKDTLQLVAIVREQGMRIVELEATIKQMEEDEHDRRMEAMEEYD